MPLLPHAGTHSDHHGTFRRDFRFSYPSLCAVCFVVVFAVRLLSGLRALIIVSGWPGLASGMTIKFFPLWSFCCFPAHLICFSVCSVFRIWVSLPACHVFLLFLVRARTRMDVECGLNPVLVNLVFVLCPFLQVWMLFVGSHLHYGAIAGLSVFFSCGCLVVSSGRFDVSLSGSVRPNWCS